jgi:hypothetical protein
MKKLLLIFMSLSTLSAIGQPIVADFENIPLAPETANNGSDLAGGFSSGEAFFPNDYNADFDFWSGWSISNRTDATTPGFVNELSAITGLGFQSANYAVSYEPYLQGETRIIFEQETLLEGLYVTNSTYAYFSMLEGDAFAKQFGGLTGNDPDFFLLTIRAYIGGQLTEESVEFFLADYTFEDNSLDYIVDEWTYVDLSLLGTADSLSFSLTSSDVGEFGMNTPAYFCMDDFTTGGPLNTQTGEKDDFKIFPNPAVEFIRVSSQKQIDRLTIFDLNGRPVLQAIQENRIDLEILEVGTYILQVTSDGRTSSQTFVKL